MCENRFGSESNVPHIFKAVFFFVLLTHLCLSHRILIENDNRFHFQREKNI